MSCCGRHVGFGITGAGGELFSSSCDISPELDALSVALEKAGALGLYQDSLVVAGQALYDVNSRMSPINCGLVKSQLLLVTAQINALVLKNTPPDERPGLLEQFSIWVKTLPSWALPVAAASAGGLVLASTTGGLLARRSSKRRRKKR